MGERGPEPGHAYGAAAIARCLEGADFPISKKDILSKYGNCQVEFKKGETMKLRDVLTDVDENEFNSPVDLEKAIKDFTKKYRVKIDILAAGHFHYSKSEAVGINSDTINIPSIIGIDPFSFSIDKLSNAGATIVGFEEGKGKVSEENIKLN
jgi:hypothetical protein